MAEMAGKPPLDFSSHLIHLTGGVLRCV